jgi:sugar phosphate isomerase/epimerase
MKPRYACADFTFPLLKHEQALQLIAMMEFEGVDIGLFEGRSHLQPSSEFPELEKRAKQLKKKLEHHGLVAADVFLQCDNDFSIYAINQTDIKRREKARDWYLKTLEYAGYLEGKHVTILPGVEISGDYQADFNRAVDELNWRIEKARERGIILGVEAHFGSLVQDPRKARQLVEKTDGLTLTLDMTHFVRLGADESDYMALIPYASHFHARNATPGNLQVVFKENVIDYDKVVRLMIETGYSGFMGIEFFWNEWENGNRVDNVSETILLKNYIQERWDHYSH